MKFYFRNNALNDLAKLRDQSERVAKMSVLLGRRRVGKTSLAIEFVKDKRYLYLFVAKKTEELLCQGFAEEIQRSLDLPIYGELNNFKDVFALLLEQAKQHPFTLIIDEFQEFFSINPSVYSDIQHLWDLNKKHSHINIIFIGSVYSLMHKIFENKKEPLFGRADQIIHLQSFPIAQLKIILQDYGITGIEELFQFYVVTGGSPKYLDILLESGCTNLVDILDCMLKENSIFLQEGKNQLIEEFGKEYNTYFSILELISRGKTSSSEISSVIQKNVSAYLDKLVNAYAIIKKFKPFDAKANSRMQKYLITDNFLKFWFRFFHRNQDAIEIHNYDFIKQVIQRDFSSYSGRLLEKFFIELLSATKKYNRIASYWERGHKNEIDIIAVNDLDKKILFAEVKSSERRNSQQRLEVRSAALLKKYYDYDVEYLRLSLADAAQFLD